MAAIYFLRSPVPMTISRAFYGTGEATDVSESTFKVVIDMTLNYYSYDRDVRYNILSKVCFNELFIGLYNLSFSALCSANTVCSANSPCSLCLQPTLRSSNFSMRHSLSMPAMR